ncbi:hypothetical protein ACOMHN_051351 [Nucella lapillus]
MTEKADESGVKSSAICAGLPDSSAKTDSDLRQIFTRFEAFNFDDNQQFQAGLAKIINDTNIGKTREQAVDLLKIKVFYYSRNIEPMDLSAYMDWRIRTNGKCENQTALTNRTSTEDDNGSPVLLTATRNKDHEQADERVKQTSKHTICANFNHTSVEQNLDPRVEQTGKDTICTNLNHPDTGIEQKCDLRVEHTSKDTVCADLRHTGTHQKPDLEITKQTISGADTPTLSDYEEKNVKSVCSVNNKTAADHDDGQRELSFAEVAELIQSGKPIPGLAQVEVLPTNVTPTPAKLHRVKKPWEQ